MKKIYLKPTIEVFKLNANNSLLSGSAYDPSNPPSMPGGGSFGGHSYDLDDEEN